jgi:hypothetical protein
MNFNFLSQWRFWHSYFVIKQRYLAIAVDHSFLLQAEDVLVEVYGFGKTKVLNRLFPSLLSFSKRMLGISPVVE